MLVVRQGPQDDAVQALPAASMDKPLRRMPGGIFSQNQGDNGKMTTTIDHKIKEIDSEELWDKELEVIFDRALGEIKDTVASMAAQAAVEVYSEAKKGGDAGSIARKISEACIDCMGAGLKKGFSAALKFMREREA